MRKLATTISAIMVAAAMVFAPVAEAQGRARQSAPSAQRGGNSRGGNRPGSHNGNRPGNSNRPSNPGNSNRPSNPGNSSRPNRPGGNRPGNTNPPSSNRPGNSHHQGYNHGNSHHGNNHGYNPGNNHGHHHGGPGHRPVHHDYGYHHFGHHHPRPGGLPPRPIGPGYHHHVPFFGRWHRPVPPPRWHYTAGAGPVFSTILGVTIGATLASSLNALAANGYTVSNYGSDVVYLSNVPQMNLMWPDAAMYYNNGILCGSQFTYPTYYYDMSRYNALYNRFVGMYGAPVSTANSGGVIAATWFGGDNRFVTIEFNGSYGNYYTTLSYGM